MGKQVSTVPKPFQTVPPTVPVKGVGVRTLVAAPKAQAANFRKRLEQLHLALSIKVANDPGCGLGPKIETANADILAGRLEQAAAELAAVETGLRDRKGYLAETKLANAETKRLAKGRGETVERSDAGGLEITTRDGMRWLLKKGRILAAHYDAGMKLREDAQLAAGGLKSCLGDAGMAAFRGGLGPTDAMLAARDRVKAALGSLGTPMLVVYAERVAIDGDTLTAFEGDTRDHLLACKITLDLLARHYGLLR